MPFTRALTDEQAEKLSHLLQQAYAGKLEPISKNPHMTPEELNKDLKCLPKTKFGDLFPITGDKIARITNPLERPGQAKSEKIHYYITSSTLEMKELPLQ